MYIMYVEFKFDESVDITGITRVFLLHPSVPLISYI